jgi:hypothetical protein
MSLECILYAQLRARMNNELQIISRPHSIFNPEIHPDVFGMNIAHVSRGDVFRMHIVCISYAYRIHNSSGCVWDAQ